MIAYQGRAHVFGDDINTDYIISSRRKRDTLDLDILKQYLMEDIDSGFSKRIEKGDFIVAGKNFGCGSAMEVASLVIKAAGISVVLAKSFSRTFYRNGTNGGLYLIKCDTNIINNRDILLLKRNKERIILKNITQKINIKITYPKGILLDIIDSGGLMKFIKSRGWFSVSTI